MDRKGKILDQMVDDYREALIREYRCRTMAQETQQAADELEQVVLSAAYEDGTIDGSNSQTRKAQEGAVIAESKEIQSARDRARTADAQAAEATADRKALEAEISLYKAWLYSQANIG